MQFGPAGISALVPCAVWTCRHQCFSYRIVFTLSALCQVSQFSTTILSAMLAGMDDREDPEDLITMEAMSGLARIFQQIDEGHVRPILINIALRIRPCFEKVPLDGV